MAAQPGTSTPRSRWATEHGQPQPPLEHAPSSGRRPPLDHLVARVAGGQHVGRCRAHAADPRRPGAGQRRRRTVDGSIVGRMASHSARAASRGPIPSESPPSTSRRRALRGRTGKGPPSGTSAGATTSRYGPSMEERCARHQFEAAEDVCRSCGHDFCGECLVYAFGANKPPYCLSCAGRDPASAPRATSTDPIKREIKDRHKQWCRARNTGHREATKVEVSPFDDFVSTPSSIDVEQENPLAWLDEHLGGTGERVPFRLALRSASPCERLRHPGFRSRAAALRSARLTNVGEPPAGGSATRAPSIERLPPGDLRLPPTCLALPRETAQGLVRRVRGRRHAGWALLDRGVPRGPRPASRPGSGVGDGEHLHRPAGRR